MFFHSLICVAFRTYDIDDNFVIYAISFTGITESKSKTRRNLFQMKNYQLYKKKLNICASWKGLQFYRYAFH